MGLCSSQEQSQNLVKKKAQEESCMKILIVGDSGVGKTSILLRFTEGTFSDSYTTTIGVDFKHVYIDVDGEKIKLMLWDTAGQERFKTITQSYYRGSRGVIVVFDLTNEASFSSVGYWLTDIMRIGSKEITVMVVGNKCDRQSDRVISEERARAYCEENKVAYYEVSAKEFSGIIVCFKQLAKLIKELDNKTGVTNNYVK